MPVRACGVALEVLVVAVRGRAPHRLDARARLSRSASWLALLGACSHGEPARAPLQRYVDEADVGRAALEASLVTRDNAYAALRLARYRPEGWGHLPEYDPEVTPIRSADGPAADARWTKAGDGERAFFDYPVQFAPNLPKVLAEPDHGGVWLDAGRFGAVWVKTETGVRAAYTCATCHASPSPGGLVVGRNNERLDVARISGVLGAWPLGTADVTGDDLDNPVAITDLRPQRWQKTMHHAATLRMDPVALAVRIETLIITSHAEAVRPPRRVAASLAGFLLSLGTAAPRPPGPPAFERTCAGCHAGDGASGEGVPLAVVGTDPAVGLSSERGTGRYRVPSLRHVGDRHRLFASGAAEDVGEVLDPFRTFAGHPFGLDLSDAERAEVLAYLRRL